MPHPNPSPKGEGLMKLAIVDVDDALPSTKGVL
jgi:hypothetical protein